MKKNKIKILIFMLGIGMIGCSTKDLRKAPTMEVKLCSLHPLEGECRVFVDGTMSCSQGKCLNGDCNNGTGKIEYPGESSQEGIFKGRILNGKGSFLTCKDRTKFDGILKNGYPDNGTFTYIDGSVYSGSVKNGLYDGKGKLIIADGSTYEGTWKNGKKNGKFNIVLSGTNSSTTYQDDEDVIEIARRKKEEEEERRRIAREEAEERRRVASEEAERRSRCAGARSKVIRILDGWDPGSGWACKNQIGNSDHMYSILSYGVSAYERLCKCL